MAYIWDTWVKSNGMRCTDCGISFIDGNRRLVNISKVDGYGHCRNCGKRICIVVNDDEEEERAHETSGT